MGAIRTTRSCPRQALEIPSRQSHELLARPDDILHDAGSPNTANVIVRSLIDHKVKTLFGLMGDANLFMVNEFVRALNGTFVPVAYEGSAVLMALSC